MTQPWYKVRARAGSASHAEILIYGDLGESAWSEQSVTASAFVRELQALDARSLTVRINSAGGSVVDGIAIHSALRRFAGEVEVVIDGAALSIASLIACAGDRVTAVDSAVVLVHAPWSMAVGNAPQLREQAEVLDRYAAAMAKCYARKTGRPEAEMLALLADGADHWYSAEEALAAGFVDEVIAAQPVAARFDISRFNPPAAFAGLARNRSMDSNTPTTDDAPEALTRSQRRAQRHDVQAAAARESEIRAMYSGFAKRDGVPELLAAQLAAGADPDAASRALLVHLGAGVEPARAAGAVPRIEVLENAGAPPRELMVDALVARVRRTEPSKPAARQYARMTTTEMARQCLAWSGRRSDDMSNFEVMGAALHGTSDFPALLAETGKRLLRTAYAAAPSGLKPAARSTITEDFRPMNRLQLSEPPELRRVNEQAEYTHGSFAEAKASYSIATYGRMFSISRQALVNDDLGAFDAATRRFGQAAAEFEAKFLCDLLVSNSGAGPTMADNQPLFHSTHKNLAGTGAVPSVTTLSAAMGALRTQTGLDGRTPINVPPRYLIVPAALEGEARALAEVVITPAEVSKVNPWMRMLEVLVEPRLDAVSKIRWYVAADPSVIEGLEYCHLNEAAPMLEMRDGWEVDGVEMKVRLDFGAAFLDWRGWYANPGSLS